MLEGKVKVNPEQLLFALNYGSGVILLTFCVFSLGYLWRIRGRVKERFGRDAKPGYPSQIVARVQVIYTVIAVSVVAVPIPSTAILSIRSFVLRMLFILAQVYLIKLVVKEEIEERVEKA